MDLKKAAHDAGFSGREIAARLHVTGATVSRWLTRRIIVPSEHVMALAALLQVEPADILPNPTSTPDDDQPAGSPAGTASKGKSRVSDQQQNEYNGPSRDEFYDDLATYEECRFNMARAASLAGKVLAGWEKKGGDKNDLRDGYQLRQMSADEQQAELRRQWRVASWMNMISEEPSGQQSFARLFDVKPEKLGIGGAPLGTRLSIGRAMTSGYNDAKQKNGPTMAEGLEPYLQQFGWEPDGDEALAYCEGFGDGLKMRPEPKPPKEPKESKAPKLGKSMNEQIAEELDAQAKAEAEVAPKRGRRQQAALPAPEAGFEDGVQTGPIH